MDEVKRNAVISQLSVIRFKIAELDNKSMGEKEYKEELQKVNLEIDALEQAIQCNETPKDYLKAPSILEVDVVDYLCKHKLETSTMKDNGSPMIEIEKRYNEEEGIEKMLTYIKEKGLII